MKTDIASQLEQLSKLHSQGKITEKEFILAKTKLLGDKRQAPDVKRINNNPTTSYHFIWYIAAAILLLFVAVVFFLFSTFYTASRNIDRPTTPQIEFK